jgi:uncharacterized glyoxalase superfamily protein PhnB
MESAIDQVPTSISVMLAVIDAQAAATWYETTLGATRLWDLGSVVGMELDGATFFLGEPVGNGWESPARLGTTSCRVEVFCDDPDAIIARALGDGATEAPGGLEDRPAPWGVHRQGGFFDPFGHLWLVGDRSPLRWRP